MNKAVFIVLSFLVCFEASGQNISEQDLSRIVDDLVASQDLNANYEEIYDNLIQLLTHPIDLNEAGEEQLRMLYILNENQIRQLIQHRNNHGLFLNKYELQSIPDLDEITLQKLIPFVTIADPNQKIDRSLFKSMLQKENSYLLYRFERTLEKKAGYRAVEDKNKMFHGTRDKHYLRMRSSDPGHYSFGFTLEKDQGEPFAWNPKARFYLTDFNSAHFQLKNKGKIRNIIIGDFQCQFGQGLIFGSSFGLGKGGETISTARKPNLGFMPYTSSNEFGFFRGAAVTLQLNRDFSLSAFYSRALRDASIQTNDSSNMISAFQLTGLHRTAKEIKDRKQIAEKSTGGAFEFKRKSFRSALLFQNIDFEFPIEKRPSLYNQFAFQGSSASTAGMSLSYSIFNFNFFGEASCTFGAGSAVISGLLGSLHERFDVAFIYRNYSRNYHSFYGSAFGESVQPQNEKGFYWGWKYKFSKRYNLSGYIDLFKFPWLGFRRYAPSTGYEWLLRLNYQPNKKISTFAQWREESKARNKDSDALLYQLDHGLKRNAWLVIAYEATDKLKLRTRLQHSSYNFNNSSTEGLLLAQDLMITFSKIKLTARYALFDSDDFENRQYCYENDAYMAFSLPAYDGTGIRSYVMLEYKALKNLNLWVRYARSKFKDREQIGSGLDTIIGNTRNDIKLQALFRF